MLFTGFDPATNNLLFEIYDEAMVELSYDPDLSLSIIAESQNVVVRRLNELAAAGERDRSVLKHAAMAIIERRRHRLERRDCSVDRSILIASRFENQIDKQRRMR